MKISSPRRSIPAGEPARHSAISQYSSRRPIGATIRSEHHVGLTLVDLLALSLRNGHETRALGRISGLRAARLQEILAIIRVRFADPAFSPYEVAGTLRLSPRYVQDLLHETGGSFTDRVLELRLQKARGMLTSRQHDDLKVSDIAYACGFSDISHFNHRFRARFGCAPTDLRAHSTPTSSPS